MKGQRKAVECQGKAVKGSERSVTGEPAGPADLNASNHKPRAEKDCPERRRACTMREALRRALAAEEEERAAEEEAAAEAEAEEAEEQGEQKEQCQ